MVTPVLQQLAGRKELFGTDVADKWTISGVLASVFSH